MGLYITALAIGAAYALGRPGGPRPGPEVPAHGR